MTDPGTREIFVFGSNLAGRHGRGSALHARQLWGARYGVGVGRTGDAYAIPTKDERLKIMPLEDIRPHVETFLKYARERPTLSFKVVEIGCGLAGYTPQDIAPMFRGASSNVHLSLEFRAILELLKDDHSTPLQRTLELAE